MAEKAGYNELLTTVLETAASTRAVVQGLRDGLYANVSNDTLYLAQRRIINRAIVLMELFQADLEQFVRVAEANQDATEK
jgi:hypothetical protein